MRSSGFQNGVLSHYLSKLERNGAIKTVREPRQTRFFPLDITEDESRVITALRKQTPRDILLTLVEEDGLMFQELVRKVNKSPSTVSLHLSRIVNDGLVEPKFTRFQKRYYIKARHLVDKLIEDYRPGMLERPISGYEDIFNSL